MGVGDLNGARTSAVKMRGRLDGDYHWGWAAASVAVGGETADRRWGRGTRGFVRCRGIGMRSAGGCCGIGANSYDGVTWWQSGCRCSCRCKSRPTQRRRCDLQTRLQRRFRMPVRRMSPPASSTVDPAGDSSTAFDHRLRMVRGPYTQLYAGESEAEPALHVGGLAPR